jgi:hypothetical protein
MNELEWSQDKVGIVSCDELMMMEARCLYCIPRCINSFVVLLYGPMALFTRRPG